MFGSAHLYVFHHPQDAARQEKEGSVVKKVSFDSAQEEIAQNKGFDMDTKGKSNGELFFHIPSLNIIETQSKLFIIKQIRAYYNVMNYQY